MPPTRTQIARMTNVSVSLVSRVLNDDPKLRVKEQTRQRIWSVYKQLSQKAHAQADRQIKASPSRQRKRQMPRRLAHNVVLPVNCEFVQRGQPLFTGMTSVLIASLHTELQQAGFRLSVVFYDPDNSRQWFDELIATAGYSDGVVLLTSVANQAVAELIRQTQYPHVSIDVRDERLDINTLGAHSLRGICEAVAYLQRQGHTRIGFLGPDHQRKKVEYTTAMLQAELPINPRWDCETLAGQHQVPDDQWRISAFQAATQYLKQTPVDQRPTAWICHNDLGGMGALEAMETLGLVPGRDLALIGYDNLADQLPHLYAHTSAARLSTLDNPMGQLGSLVAQRLINQIVHQQHDIRHEYIPPQLVLRQSTQRTLTADAAPAHSQPPCTATASGSVKP